MEEFFLQYGIFLAKSVTFFVLLVLIIVIAGSSRKDKGSEKKGKIVIKKFNDEIEDYKDTLLDATQETLEREKKLKELKKSKKETNKTLKKNLKEGNEIEHKNSCFVLNFNGDREASDTDKLAKEITAILTLATKNDEVIIKLESPGGTPHGYGYGASQILRITEQSIPVTICVDKIAASGGYMMACVGTKILCAPFAIVGSIGVVAELININKVLTKHDIEVEHHTAGEYKRTLTMIGENTDKGRKKFQETLENIHALFKNHVSQYRPDLDMKDVATGEFWFGTEAKEKGLIDDIITSDSYIVGKANENNVFTVEYKSKTKVSDKLSSLLGNTINNGFEKIMSKISERRFY